ncbi:MAG: hypothetical protein IKP89_10035 [Bacteroidales bacterium]|nr:hypothetical protein [Bacteroidales bacterium]
MEDGDYNYIEAFKQLVSAKDSHRTIEEVVVDLQKELRPVKEESILVHAMRLFVELDHRFSSPLFKHLQSPMRQTLYMVDVYYSIVDREESVEMDPNRWDRIALLLDEIEMTYFVNIAFPNDGDFFHDERDNQIDVSLSTFIEYFGNALLIYEEQTLDRIERYFKPYDSVIESRYGFTVDEAIRFFLHVRKINNDKLNAIIKPYAETFSRYASKPEEWKKLTQSFIDRGIVDPREWWFQPELSGMLETMQTNPGEIHIHSKEELMDVDIDSGHLQRIIDFFAYDKGSFKGKTVYYADKHLSETHPLIQFDGKYVCPCKFIIEGLYFRIDEALRQDATLGQKYKQNKDTEFENKVVELFKRFFPEKTKIFTNYCVDGVAENDLLVIYGDKCIVVEIKDCGFRPPFRDPIKAYSRIKRDYENAIQLGYEQCKRVEDVLWSGKDVDIMDADNKHKVLYQLKNKKIGDVWLIVVTDFKYGSIQTNLSSLLKKEEDALYPWSVCVDDLESMFLMMSKKLKGKAPAARFVEFLDYRERYQEHIICADELEICGWYLNDSEQFKEYADKEQIVCTTSNMAVIFDAYYRIGIGFRNELDIEYKKNHTLPDYPKHFDFNEMTSEKIRGKA